ncbi:MAG: hypothetical protein AAGF74_12980 [Pseudomonadota bacterium]
MKKEAIDFTEMPFGSMLSIAYRQIQGILRDPLSEFTLPAPLATVLWVIVEQPGRRQTYYADACKIDLATFGRYLDTLSRRGLVTVEPDAEDGRAKLARPTSEGVALLYRIVEALKRTDKEFIELLGRDQFERMREDLARFLENTKSL